MLLLWVCPVNPLGEAGATLALGAGFRAAMAVESVNQLRSTRFLALPKYSLDQLAS
jgi:hypothetical protein